MCLFGVRRTSLAEYFQHILSEDVSQAPEETKIQALVILSIGEESDSDSVLSALNS